MSETKIADWISKNQHILIALSNDIWSHPEKALEEYHSSNKIASYLEENGFTIEWNIADMQTSFKASWGKGSPTIGYIGEYDALTGLSQKAVPYRDPISVDAAGHGCGHNLLGTALAGSAVGLKYTLEKSNIPGTIVYFGCPAEETMTGKVKMASLGCFGCLDVALSWHPMTQNYVLEFPMQSMYTAKFTFFGKSSHAAVCPEDGRSALDAVELMNIGANYLREHVPTDVRIHYSITDGGGEPNLVHSHAQSWYYIRAASRSSAYSVFERICDIARGAALMTGTQGEVSLLSGCYETLEVEQMNDFLFSCLKDTPLPKWSDDEKNFAFNLTLGEGNLHENILPLKKNGDLIFGSTDLSDVSQVVPTGQIAVCAAPTGTALHTWQFCACAGTTIGHKAMLYASEVLAVAGFRLITDSNILDKIQKEFLQNKCGHTYIPFEPKTFKF